MSSLYNAFLVEDDKRDDFYMDLFQGNFMLGLKFEASVFNFAGIFTGNRDGFGLWDFWEIKSNHEALSDMPMAGFLALDESDKYSVSSPLNGFEARMTGFELGLGVSLIALSNLCFSAKNQRELEILSELHSRLQSYISYLGSTDKKRIKNVFGLID